MEAPSEWLQSFRETGQNFNELRKLWRKKCLRCHPDKQPEGGRARDGSLLSLAIYVHICKWKALRKQALRGTWHCEHWPRQLKRKSGGLDEEAAAEWTAE